MMRCKHLSSQCRAIGHQFKPQLCLQYTGLIERRQKIIRFILQYPSLLGDDFVEAMFCIFVSSFDGSRLDGLLFCRGGVGCLSCLALYFVEAPCPYFVNDLRISSPKWFIQNGKVRETQRNKTKPIFSTFSVFSICFKVNQEILLYFFICIICFLCFSLQPKTHVHFENRPDGSELSRCTTPRAGKSESRILYQYGTNIFSLIHFVCVRKSLPIQPSSKAKKWKWNGDHAKSSLM